jgi:hypothetical protein
MQFIEASMLGVRSARLSFASATRPIRITLFPMVHVGEAEFYKETYADARSHDVIFIEGVHSPIATRITRSYRWLVGARGMDGLIVQPRFPATEAGARIVHADLSQDEFEAEWRSVPLWLRLAVYLLAPAVGLRRRWRYSRAKLAKEMACEDQPSFAELLALSPETGALTRPILLARDERLIERLRVELDERPSRPLNLAIVYGAMHMRAVVRELTDHRDFVPWGAEWRTVLST